MFFVLICVNVVERGLSQKKVRVSENRVMERIFGPKRC